MIPLERRADYSTYEKGEYALCTYPTMYRGKVYMEATRVVLVESVSVLGDIQKYILPGQRFSCKPHHLSTIHKLSKDSQRLAGERFNDVLFFKSMEEAGRGLSIGIPSGSQEPYVSSQEGSSGG